VIELLLNPREERLSSLWDALIYMRQVCLKDGALPDEFEKILSCQEDWHKLPLYKLKLLRYVLTVHNQVRRLKDPEAEFTDQVGAVEKLILRQYVHESLSALSGLDYKNVQLSETEVCSASRMCDWSESESFFNDSKLQHIVAESREQLAEHKGDVTERCVVCDEIAMMLDYRSGACSKGHKFSRCSLTLLLCQGRDYRKCSCCDAFAQVLPTQEFKWTVADANACLFCDSRLIRV